MHSVTFALGLSALFFVARAHTVLDPAQSAQQAQSVIGDVEPRPCRRVSKYQVFFEGSKAETKVDVGVCDGGCGDAFNCKVREYGTMTIVDPNGRERDIRFIKSCECDDNCQAVKTFTSIEVPENVCKGKCDESTDEVPPSCTAGIQDNYNQAPDNELATPSAALLAASFFQSCSAGTTNRFDHFIDNRCFGHTFSSCVTNACPIAEATLEVCLRAANVFLTHTDSLILGTNGVPRWSRGLPALSGTGWGVGTTMCWNLTLGNLPGNGYDILPDIMASGDLDVVVQDDTAVDFLRLQIRYENCKTCEPVVIAHNALFSTSGVSEYPSIEECDCFGTTAPCKREKQVHIFYPGTQFQSEVDVGRCAGACPGKFSRCTPEYSAQAIESPNGPRDVKVVKQCNCKSFWTPVDAVLEPVTKTTPAIETKTTARTEATQTTKQPETEAP